MEVCDAGYNRDLKTLPEVLINPNFVASVAPDETTEGLLAEGRLPGAIAKSKFSESSSRMVAPTVVVGDVGAIQSKLFPGILKDGLEPGWDHLFNLSDEELDDIFEVYSRLLIDQKLVLIFLTITEIGLSRTY